MTTGVERSGTTLSIRDSRLPRGTWTAPGMCPSSHSSCSRTSIQAAPSMLLRRAGVDLLDPVLDLLEKFPVRRHCYKNDSSATRIPRATFSAGPLDGSRPASPCIVAVGRLPRGGRGRRRPHARHADDAAPAEARASGKPPVPQGLTGARRPQIVAAFKNWPHGSIDTMQRLGLQYTGGTTPAQRQPERDRPVLPGRRAALGRLPVGRPERRSSGRRSSAATRSSRAAPTTSSTRVLPAGAGSAATRCSSRRSRTRCSSRAPGCSSRDTSSPPSGSTRRAAKAAAGERRGARRPGGRPASTRTT